MTHTIADRIADRPSDRLAWLARAVPDLIFAANTVAVMIVTATGEFHCGKALGFSGPTAAAYVAAVEIGFAAAYLSGAQRGAALALMSISLVIGTAQTEYAASHGHITPQAVAIGLGIDVLVLGWMVVGHRTRDAMRRRVLRREAIARRQAARAADQADRAADRATVRAERAAIAARSAAEAAEREAAAAERSASIAAELAERESEAADLAAIAAAEAAELEAAELAERESEAAAATELADLLRSDTDQRREWIAQRDAAGDQPLTTRQLAAAARCSPSTASGWLRDARRQAPGSVREPVRLAAVAE